MLHILSVISIPNNIPARTYDHGSWPQPDRTWPYTATITPPFQSVLSSHWELCVHTSPKWGPWTIHWSTTSKIHIKIWIWIRRCILHKTLIKAEVTFFCRIPTSAPCCSIFPAIACYQPIHRPRIALSQHHNRNLHLIPALQVGIKKKHGHRKGEREKRRTPPNSPA